MLSPTSLSVAVTVAERGSATAAAERLHISQPAVSYHLKKLEKAVGGALFRRGSAGVVPTAAGERLVQVGREVLETLERCEREARRIAAGEERVLRISSICFTNYHWLPSVLRELSTCVGEIRVELDVEPTRRPIEALDRGDLDLVLTTEPPRTGPFRCTSLFEDEIVGILAPDHPLSSRERLHPGDLSDQTVIVFDRDRSDLLDNVLRPAGVEPAHLMSVPVTEALLELVRAGMGVSAMASWVARPDLDAGRLVARPLGDDGIHRHWWAVMSERSRESPLLGTFIEVLEAAGPRADSRASA